MILVSAHGEIAARLPVDGQAAFSAANEQERLQDLARLGFVRPMNAGSAEQHVWRWSGSNPAADRALLSLLARFDLHLEVGLAADEVTWIAAAIQERVENTARDAFSGTGFGPDEAIRTCLGEFAEFRAWLYRPEDSVRRCHASALHGPMIEPWDVLGFSPAQRAQRCEFNTAWVGYDAIPAPEAFAGEIDWNAVTAESDRSTRWLPTQLCFGRYGERAACADADWRADSNGCAAGPTPQSALAHALLELVERDATGIWWYGGVRRPAVPLPQDEAVGRALANREAMGQQICLLDLTHDLEIPVVAAILIDADNGLLGTGFGCHIDHGRAVRSAYRELSLMELSIDFARRRVAQAGDAARLQDRRLLAWLDEAKRLPHLRPDETLVARGSAPVACDDARIVELVRERLRRAGLAAYVLDLEREDIGIPAVRSFVPGLCHFKPRFGFKRLIEVPRALRWRDAGFGPQDLSTLPLMI